MFRDSSRKQALYQNQPIPGKYERGHLVPVNILSYSNESARATFTYTNCVPQIAGFNRGEWKKYELRIGKYAREICSPHGGTLYLITGTLMVKFTPKNIPGGRRVDKGWYLRGGSMAT